MRRLPLVAGLCVVLLGCGSEDPGPNAFGTGAPTPTAPPAATTPLAPLERALVVSFGDDIAPAIRARVLDLVRSTAPMALPVREIGKDELPPELHSDSWGLSFGDTATTKSVASGAEVSRLAPEGFLVRSGTVNGAHVLVSTGRAPEVRTANHGNLGAAYGAYALLEELGFSFLHPLSPTKPASLTFPASTIDRTDAPRFRVRGIHLHTMHPLELTELLEGFGKTGPGDQAGFDARLPEWDSFLEWMLANRQNRVEWVLLWADGWKDFGDSAVRQQRLRTLIEHAHARGISAGADAALALQQQHMFRLIRDFGDLESEKSQIRSRLDWLYDAGFDFLSTESGSTEFTHPEPSRMLAWMNEAAEHSVRRGRTATIKVHCSTGQVAEGYTDPKGAPLNFNFLPHYATPKLGVLPHTVQVYGLHDPAPTYGNVDFRYMKDFLEEEVGSREVLWHPETAYWVTYDSVPLFLPLYAERRVSDLRILAADERAGRMGRGAHAGKPLDGQMVFSSGWEWGYWLNDVAAARAAWNPHEEAQTDREATLRVLEPVARALGRDALEWTLDVAESQHELLVLGKVGGAAPADIIGRNGMAYLEGFDAMADVAGLGESLGIDASPVTQPERVGLVEVRNPLRTGPRYDTEIAPLLSTMETTFGSLATVGESIASRATPRGKPFLDELAAGARLVHLRAAQVHGLYDYAYSWLSFDVAKRAARLGAARSALDEAGRIVMAREPHYRVEADRIAGWRSNPTAYDFTYLWFARSLYFWWRDEGKAVDAPQSPCYLNVMDPADVALGEGIVTDLAGAIRRALGGVTECLAPPSREPVFPQQNLRSRP
ncbi:MAG: hypothetical protein U0174_09350 [Polyangiaceae bacterium]